MKNKVRIWIICIVILIILGGIGYYVNKTCKNCPMFSLPLCQDDEKIVSENFKLHRYCLSECTKSVCVPK